MTKKLSAVVLLILIFNAGGPRAQSQDTTMSLESCILTALKNNLGVAIEIINPELAELSLAFSKEKYIPGLSFGFSSQNTSSASFSWIEAAAKINSQDKSYYIQVSQFVPTGGRFYATLSSYKSESNRSFQTINPRFGSTLAFSFYQPLLRNFGLVLNKRDIVIARNNRDMSEIQFRSVLQDTIYKVEQAYWNLVYSIEDLRVRRQSLELARDLLAKNKREAEVGTIPGGATDSLRDAFRLKYKNWSVGLILSVPINNFLTRAHFVQIRLNLDQALLRIKNQEQQVFLEIKNAVRDVKTDYKRVQAYKVARELAEKKLQAEEKKLKVGLTTNYLVLWQRRDLANARSAELKAIIDYNLSLSGLEKALGTSLKSKNIKVHELLQKDGMD